MQQDAARPPPPAHLEAEMTTPEDPFATPDQPGQQPGYGQPQGQPGGYGQPPAGAAPYGQPMSSGWQGPPLASWGLRVQSSFIDYFALALLATLVRFTISSTLGTLISLAAIVWGLYNAYQSGETGQSYGKKIAGTRLLREQDGQVLGGGLAIGRYFLHILDAIPCYLGFLWPLWDGKKQTFADKIVKSVVIKV
jgi:uncharacterized RDD family membrane protein YckC